MQLGKEGFKGELLGDISEMRYFLVSINIGFFY
jgi:hypothetical protein